MGNNDLQGALRGKSRLVFTDHPDERQAVLEDRYIDLIGEVVEGGAWVYDWSLKRLRERTAKDFSAVHSECLSTENGQADKMDKPCGCSQGGCAIEDGDELYPGYCCRRTTDREDADG